MSDRFPFPNFISLLLSLLLAFTIPSIVLAANSPGRSGAEFLKIDVGARAAAMAGSYSSSGADVYSAFYNPSSIADIDHYEIGLQHNTWIQSINQNFIGGVFPTESIGTFGASINLVDFGDLKRTTIASGQAGNSLGSFDAGDLAVSLTWARKVRERVRFGSTLKYVRSSLDSHTANAFALDAGIKVSPFKMWDVGLTLQNFGTDLEFVSDKSELPLSVRLGNSLKFFDDSLLLSIDLLKYRYSGAEVAVGAEYRFFNSAGFRIGYNSKTDDNVDEGLSAGVGVELAGISIDYSYVPFGELGNSHRVSIGYKFGGGAREKQAQAAAISDDNTGNIACAALVAEKPSAENAEGGYLLEELDAKDLPPRAHWVVKAAKNLIRKRLSTNGFNLVESRPDFFIKPRISQDKNGKFSIRIDIYNLKDEIVYSAQHSGDSTRFVDLVAFVSDRLSQDRSGSGNFLTRAESSIGNYSF